MEKHCQGIQTHMSKTDSSVNEKEQLNTCLRNIVKALAREQARQDLKMRRQNEESGDIR